MKRTIEEVNFIKKHIKFFLGLFPFLLQLI
jgi:hypothetical protein